MRRLAIACSSALILVMSVAGTALAWDAPVLEAECAPDETSFAWSIFLTPEENQNIEFAWNAQFTGSWTQDFGDDGLHAFTTDRGGTTLFARYVSDHGAGDSAAANTQLCADIDIEKTNDAEGGTVEAGTLVTFTYAVTNIGALPLDNVRIEDLFANSDPQTACKDIVRGPDNPGNDDDILDPEETWWFTCSKELTGTHHNEACVYADIFQELDLLQDDGPDASDCSENEVAVIEGGAEGATGTPAASLPDSAAITTSTSGALLAFGFALILLTSLGGLAYANVRSGRR